MKLWKKLAFTGVSALMVGTLAACGSGSKDKADASDSTTLQMYQIGDKPDNFDQLMDVANKRIMILLMPITMYRTLKKAHSPI